MAENESGTSLDITAPTVEEAIETGLARLGLSRNEVIIEIIEEGSRGVLGLGARDAVVRLNPLVAPRPAGVSRPMMGGTGSDDDDARVGREVLESLLSQMHIKATVQAHRAELGEDDTENPWVLDIRGSDLGILIGRRGETLDSLQYITRLIVSRELQRRANLVLDVEGYKSRRADTLRKLAQRMASQARKLGRTVALEPMPPNERRIIHIALRDDDSVTTESIGQGDRRKVTIIPRKAR
jgi:spoIIIJ-associated protein